MTFVRRLILCGLAATMLAACDRTTDAPPPDVWQTRLEAEIARLSAADFRSARAGFRLLADDAGAPHEIACRAEYGYTLSIAFEFVGALLNAADWFGDDNGNVLGAPVALAPAADTAVTPEIDAIVSSFLDAAREAEIEPLLASLDRMLADGGCTIEVPDGILMETASRTWVRLGERFEPSHAMLLRGVFRAVRGLIMWIGAWDLRLDFAGILALARAGEDRDPLVVLRSWAGPIDASPNFLRLHPDRGPRLLEAGPDLQAALRDLRQAARMLFADGGADHRRSVFGWVDASGDGEPGPGDELWLGILAADPTIEILGQPVWHFPVDLADGDLGGFGGALVFSLIRRGWLERLDGLLARVDENLAGRGPLFNLAEINRLLPLPLVPEVVAVDLARWFPADLERAPTPRTFLPAWGRWAPPVTGVAGPFTDYVSFMIEVELPVEMLDAVTGDAFGSAWCTRCAAGERFGADRWGPMAGAFALSDESVDWLGVTAPTPIADDCSSPTVADGWGYAWFQDPTLGGMLYVRPEGFGDFCVNDPVSPGNWLGGPVARGDALPADRYLLNRLLIEFLGGLPVSELPF